MLCGGQESSTERCTVYLSETSGDRWMQHVEDESEHLCFHPDKQLWDAVMVSSVEFQSEASVTTP